jgi:hypothetical protein
VVTLVEVYSSGEAVHADSFDRSLEEITPMARYPRAGKTIDLEEGNPQGILQAT